MPPFTDIWEVTPQTVHPRAVQLLGENSIVWDYGDGDSPLGNDPGADIFASFLNSRIARPSVSARGFLSEELAFTEISEEDWDLLDPVDLQEALDADDGFSILQRDEVVLGLAFAQLLVDGTVDDEIRRLALLADTDVALVSRGGGSEGMKR